MTIANLETKMKIKITGIYVSKSSPSQSERHPYACANLSGKIKSGSIDYNFPSRQSKLERVCDTIFG